MSHGWNDFQLLCLRGHSKSMSLAKWHFLSPLPHVTFFYFFLQPPSPAPFTKMYQKLWHETEEKNLYIHGSLSISHINGASKVTVLTNVCTRLYIEAYVLLQHDSKIVELQFFGCGNIAI